MFDKRKYYGSMGTSRMKHFLICFLIFFVFLSSLVILASKPSLASSGVNFYSYTPVEEKRSSRIEVAEATDTDKKNEETKSPKKKSIVEKLFGEEGEELKERPDRVRVLRPAGIERIGSEVAYEDFAGVRFAKYFSVAQSVEIFQQAKPIDTYILDAKAIRILGNGAGASSSVLEWNEPVEFRSQITPEFTRAYRTQFTLDNPEIPGGQIRFVLDYRDIYRQYYPKWPHLLWYSYLQPEITFISFGKISGIGWYYDMNAGFRYSTIDEKDTKSSSPADPWTMPSQAGDENRYTYFLYGSLAPNARLEFFGKMEYYKSKRPHSTFIYSPDHYYYRGEVRVKSMDMKTSIVPAISYSYDKYYPLKNTFEKYEIELRVGRDFTNRFSMTSLAKYVLALRTEKDNTAPTYNISNPFKDSAAWMGIENRASYNIWNDFYLQGGIDYAAGMNMSDFDNWGTFAGIEYYKPGVLRANFGWNTNYYYNIDDCLNTVGFKIFFFM